jgi:hypothetical protein
MNDRAAPWAWFGFGAVTLAGLWLAIVAGWPPIEVGGAVFLATPLLASLVTAARTWRDDRVSALCVAGLIAFFCLTWWA